MERLFIIDASGYLYRSYFAIRNITNSKGESTNALYGFVRSVLKLFKDFQPDHVVAVFDGPRNAIKRMKIYPDYKAHRSAMPPDLLYQIAWAQEYCLLRGIPFLNIPEVEADDTMGSLAKWSKQHEVMTYLCTSDKDMYQLVNHHIKILNTYKDNQILGEEEVEQIYGVPPAKMIDLLALTGDTSDNVPGVPGFGPKTAASLLQQFGSLNYILEHPEVLPDKKKDIIINNRDKALISQQLVTLDTEVEIPHDNAFYQLKTPNSEKLRTFYANMSFNTLLKELERDEQVERPKSEQEEVFYSIVDDEESFKALIDYLSTQHEICVATKSTHYQAIKGNLVGLGFCVEPTKAWYVPANGKLGLEVILKGVKPLFENPKICFYGHNIKHDYQVLQNSSITIATICFDTILASYLLNSHSRQHSLEYLALSTFGKVKTPANEIVGKGKSEIGMADVAIEKLGLHCCEDVDYICRLKNVLEIQLKERKLDSLLKDLELPLLSVLAKMERHGIFLDQEYLKNLSVDVAQQIKKIEQSIYQQAGQEFNLNSPKQLSEILFTKLGIKAPKKTATGLSTNADVLISLKKQYPIAENILEYRTLEKLRSTYTDILLLEVFPKTNRIHSTFNQSVAATGRLSSQDPNLQNIPVRTEIGRKIREAFRPEKEGWSYLAADYSQVELRLLAHLSEDQNLLTAFNNNEDIHTFTAAAIFGVPLHEVTQEQRYQAKTVNFGIIYGQQAYGLSQELGIDVREASIFIDTYFKRYQNVKSYLENCKDMARRSGKAVTYTGRERLIPEITSKNGMLRAAAERLAVNTPIQGTAADLIKMAMLDINKQIDNQQKTGYMILQIHDELIFEVPDSEIPSFEILVRESMQGVMKLKVPLIVDIHIGKNWKEC